MNQKSCLRKVPQFVSEVLTANKVGENLTIALAAAGASLADLVRTQTFTTDIDRFFENVDVRMKYFGESLPTSTTVEVRRLSHPDFLVEVEAIAVIKP